MKPVQGSLGLYCRLFKRAVDLALVIAGLLLAGPILLAVAALVRLKLGSPVIFRQVRPGLRAKAFVIYKFRTMTEDRDAEGRLLPDAQRLKPLGRFLRASSLDELPELLNVLRGDMSLVGPRPLLMEYLPRYTPEQQRRHEVRPGITGLAQAHGRQTLPFSERLRLDVWYVDHVSCWLDLRTLFQTVLSVCGSRGVVLEQTLDEVDNIGLSRDIHPTAGYGQGTTLDLERARKLAAGPH